LGFLQGRTGQDGTGRDRTGRCHPGTGRDRTGQDGTFFFFVLFFDVGCSFYFLFVCLFVCRVRAHSPGSWFPYVAPLVVLPSPVCRC